MPEYDAIVRAAAALYAHSMPEDAKIVPYDKLRADQQLTLIDKVKVVASALWPRTALTIHDDEVNAALEKAP